MTHLRNRAVETGTSEKIYFTAPKFEDEKDQAYADSVADQLRDIGYLLVLPDEDNKNQKTFDNNVRDIKGCNIVVALVDEFDTDIFWEMGYAHAMHKPVLALSKSKKRVSMTLAYGSRAHFTNVKDFIKAMQQTGKTGILPKTNTNPK